MANPSNTSGEYANYKKHMSSPAKGEPQRKKYPKIGMHLKDQQGTHHFGTVPVKGLPDVNKISKSRNPK